MPVAAVQLEQLISAISHWMSVNPSQAQHGQDWAAVGWIKVQYLSARLLSSFQYISLDIIVVCNHVSLLRVKTG